MLKITEFKALPKISPQHARPCECEASLLIPVRGSAEFLDKTVNEARAALSAVFAESYEIILIPNPPPHRSDDGSVSAAQRLEKNHAPYVKAVPHLCPPNAPGKGSALRTGYLASRGRFLYFTDADLPYDLCFIAQALECMKRGAAFVSGNRRLPISHFDVPVGLLPLAYKRHRLGLAFNQVARILLGLNTTDTQAGLKALQRSFADQAFARMTCPGFFFDLELFLAAKALKQKHEELEVTLFLNSEKSTVRIFKESILAGYWLFRILIQSRMGCYRS